VSCFHRIIESLRLEKASKIIKSNRQGPFCKTREVLPEGGLPAGFWELRSIILTWESLGGADMMQTHRRDWESSLKLFSNLVAESSYSINGWCCWPWRARACNSTCCMQGGNGWGPGAHISRLREGFYPPALLGERCNITEASGAPSLLLEVPWISEQQVVCAFVRDGDEFGRRQLQRGVCHMHLLAEA